MQVGRKRGFGRTRVERRGGKCEEHGRTPSSTDHTDDEELESPVREVRVDGSNSVSDETTEGETETLRNEERVEGTKVSQTASLFPLPKPPQRLYRG